MLDLKNEKGITLLVFTVIIIFIILLSGVTIFFIMKHQEKEPITKLDSSFTNLDNEDKEETAQIPSSANGAKYENEYLKIFDMFEDEDMYYGKIANISYSNNWNIRTKDNTVYSGNILSSIDKRFQAKENFKNFSNKTIYPYILIKNKDNSYSIYDQRDSERNFDFKMDNLVCVMFQDDENIVSYTLDNNRLCLTKQKVNGDIVLDHVPLKIDEGILNGTTDRVLYDGKIKSAILKNESIEIKKEDDTLYYVSLGFDSYLNANSNYGTIDNVDNTYLYSNLNTNIYTVTSDKENIYIRTGMLDNFETKKVKLPDGYNISDIKAMYDIYIGEKLLLYTKDNKFYFFNNSKWEELLELSNMRKENHIVNIVEDSGLDIYILCDDGYLYSLNK